ncbi:MAG: hypothetical protein JXA94_05885, partial [Parachlamydiales bacterium]|nr:hypothetical protein [Parachlamydiales bacterium]
DNIMAAAPVVRRPRHEAASSAIGHAIVETAKEWGATALRVGCLASYVPTAMNAYQEYCASTYDPGSQWTHQTLHTGVCSTGSFVGDLSVPTDLAVVAAGCVAYAVLNRAGYAERLKQVAARVGDAAVAYTLQGYASALWDKVPTSYLRNIATTSVAGWVTGKIAGFWGAKSASSRAAGAAQDALTKEIKQLKEDLGKANVAEKRAKEIASDARAEVIVLQELIHRQGFTIAQADATSAPAPAPRA